MSRPIARPAASFLLLAALLFPRGADAEIRLKSLFDGGKQSNETPSPLPAPEPPPPLKDSDWVPADQKGSVSDGNVSAPEKLNFWSRLQNNSFDSLCRQARIPAAHTFRPWDFNDLRPEYRRYLRQMPTGELAILDEAKLDIGTGFDPRRQFDLPPMVGHWNVFVGARIAGTSLIIRPLKSHKACEDLKRMANLKDIKLVLPMSARRLSQMGVGEIWKIPLSWRLGVGGGAGDNLTFPVNVTVGRFSERLTSVTLRRLDESTLRLRLRLDEARVLDAEGKLNANIPILIIGLPGAELILLNSISRNVAQLVNQYMAVQLGLTGNQRTGELYAVEFLLDPNDAPQMEQLSKLLNGDLSVLKLLREAGRSVKEPDTLEDSWDQIETVAKSHEEALKEQSTFSGFDHYKHREGKLRARLPIALRYDRDRVIESDHMVVRDQPSSEYVAHRSEKRSRRAYGDIPFLGELFVREAQRNAEVILQRDGSGQTRGPAIVYVHQEGFVRQDDKDVRKMVLKLADMMRLAGAKGGPDNPKTALPIDDLLKPSTAPHTLGPEDFVPFREGRYRRGTGGLTIVFSATAVREFLRASGRALLAAYANTLDGWRGAIAKWLSSNAFLRDGQFHFDKDEARAAAKAIAKASKQPMRRVLHSLNRTAERIADLIKDLDAARNAGGVEEQAKALLNVVAGRGKSKLGYNDVVAVLIQLVDPAHLSAEFFLNLQPGERTDLGVKARYVMHPLGDPMLSGAANAKLRFRQPSLLTD